MREEVVLDIVYHRNGLVEELLCTTTVHQNCLGTEHLRHFRQHGCTALSHEPVAEFAYQGIGSDTRESV